MMESGKDGVEATIEVNGAASGSAGSTPPKVAFGVTTTLGSTPKAGVTFSVPFVFNGSPLAAVPSLSSVLSPAAQMQDELRRQALLASGRTPFFRPPFSETARASPPYSPSPAQRMKRIRHDRPRRPEEYDDDVYADDGAMGLDQHHHAGHFMHNQQPHLGPLSPQPMSVITQPAGMPGTMMSPMPGPMPTVAEMRTWSVSVDQLNRWIRFSVTLLAVALVFLVAGWFVIALQRDYEAELANAISLARGEIDTCRKQYSGNNCDPSARPPQLEDYCQKQQACLERDPEEVGRAKVGFKTVAKILNEFISELDSKTLVVLGCLIAGIIVMTSYGSRPGREESAPAPSVHYVTSQPTAAYYPAAPYMTPYVQRIQQ